MTGEDTRARVQRVADAGAHDNLHAALAAVQAQLPVIGKSSTARVKHRDGGQHSYTYATLADVHQVVLPLLAAAGLSWTCLPYVTGDRRELVGLLTHAASGEQVDTAWELPRTSDPQAVGSAITYGRRYLLTAVVGVALDDDDDGAAAAAAASSRRRMDHPTDGPDGSTSAARLSELHAEAAGLYRSAAAADPGQAADAWAEAFDGLGDDPWAGGNVRRVAGAVAAFRREVTDLLDQHGDDDDYDGQDDDVVRQAGALVDQYVPDAHVPGLLAMHDPDAATVADLSTRAAAQLVRRLSQYRTRQQLLAAAARAARQAEDPQQQLPDDSGAGADHGEGDAPASHDTPDAIGARLVELHYERLNVAQVSDLVRGQTVQVRVDGRTVQLSLARLDRPDRDRLVLQLEHATRPDDPRRTVLGIVQTASVP